MKQPAVFKKAMNEIKVPLAAPLLLNSIEFDIPDEKVYFTENEVNRINEYVNKCCMWHVWTVFPKITLFKKCH